MKIADALHIPENTGTDAFITRLDTTDPARVRRDLQDFVVAEAVEERLDRMLKAVGERLTQGLDVGRFIFGTFGSGKSHLMAVLGKMLESDETVYAVGDPALSRLRAEHGWLDARNPLVVRLNMMGKDDLLSAMYDAYTRALPEGVEPPHFTDEQRVFDLIEADAQRMGGLDALLVQAVAGGYLGSVKRYRLLRDGDRDERMGLAADLLNWRNHGKTELRSEDLWVGFEEGVRRLTAHAKGQGHDTVVWLVDELIIWIRGQSRDAYVTALNQLSSMVDHDQKLHRAVPQFVVVAIQHDIARTCPADLSEQDFHQHLGHIRNRFEPQLELQDQDLFEVAARRVLRPIDDQKARYAAAVDRTFTKHRKAIRELSGDIDPARVRALYPFHPALLRALVDITQALSRNRTAMAALYTLLAQNAELEVGQFIPMGALFPVVFDGQTVASARDRRSTASDRFVAAAESYERLAGKIEDVARSVTGGSADELKQLVRTVLLCQLSEKEYFVDGRPLREAITASTLLRLNQSDVRAMTERTGISKVARMFRLLAERTTEVRVSGDETDPHIKIKTERVEAEQVIAAARSEVRHSDRFAYIRLIVDQHLGLGLGRQTETKKTVLWRGTRRAGDLKLCNVRKQTYAGSQNEFEAREAFMVLVDYPFDEDEGCTRDDDIATVQNARSRRRQWTVTWLPAHFTEAERQSLDRAAAIERISKDQRRYLESYSPRDAEAVAEALEAARLNLDNLLGQAVRRVYFEKGQLHALSETLDGVSLDGLSPAGAIDSIARQILSARYPQHPLWKREARARDLEKVAGWVVQAAVTHEPVALKGQDMKLVEDFAVPLEMAHAGNSSLTPRTDGRYLSAVKRWATAQGESFALGQLYDFLADEGRQGFGLNDDGCAFFAWYLLHAEGYEARRKGKVVTLERFRNLDRKLELRKGRVVSSETWERAYRVAEALLGVARPGDLPSVPNQAKLDADGRRAAIVSRDAVQRLREGIEEICGWAGVTADDSHRVTALKATEDALTRVIKGGDAFERVQALASLEEGAHYGTFVDILKRPRTGERPLDAEQRAVVDIGHAKLAFRTVDTRGDDAQKLQVVTALRNLLRDPVGRRLAEHGVAWAEAASKVAEGLMAAPKPKEGEKAPTPVKAPTPGTWRKAHAAPRKALGTWVQKALAKALMEVEGDDLVVELIVRPADGSDGIADGSGDDSRDDSRDDSDGTRGRR